MALAAIEGEIQMALRHTLDLESVETTGERASRLFAGGGGVSRPAARAGVSPLSSRENVIEIYRGGVRSLINY